IRSGVAERAARIIGIDAGIEPALDGPLVIRQRSVAYAVRELEISVVQTVSRKRGRKRRAALQCDDRIELPASDHSIHRSARAGPKMLPSSERKLVKSTEHKTVGEVERRQAARRPDIVDVLILRGNAGPAPLAARTRNCIIERFRPGVDR